MNESNAPLKSTMACRTMKGEKSRFESKTTPPFYRRLHTSIRKFSKRASADADRFLTQRHSAMVKTRSFHRPDGKTVPGYLGEPTHTVGARR
jgi:hypothetical protein